MVELEVDGKRVASPGGASLLEGLVAAGFRIPQLCYHPQAGAGGHCGLCQVQLGGPDGPLVKACMEPLRPESVVLLASPAAIAARRRALVALMASHPAVCPDCDSAGQCELQAVVAGLHEPCEESARTADANSNRWERYGERLLLNRALCVHCGRCARLAAIPGRGVAGGRAGDGPPGELPEGYSQAVAGACPTGALRSRSQRHFRPAWLGRATPTVCPECARGCAIFVDQGSGGVGAVRPRLDPGVNGWWLCDEAHLAVAALGTGRVETPHFLGSPLPETAASTRRILALAAEALAGVRAQGGTTALLLSASLTWEEGGAAVSFAGAMLGRWRAFICHRPDGCEDGFLRCRDRDSNRRGLTQLAEAMGVQLEPQEELPAAAVNGEISALLMVGADHQPFELPPSARIDASVALAWRHGPVTHRAKALVPLPGPLEKGGDTINVTGRLRRFHAASPAAPMAEELPVLLARLAGAMGGGWNDQGEWPAPPGSGEIDG